MGLSSQQVSTDLHNWKQTMFQAQTSETPKPPPIKRQQPPQNLPLKCPRCDSSNTKFCYYNNYNKTQPRHFCKSCKRHWTNGGTLRNVPVGGAAKNKRRKASNTNTTTTAAAKSLPLTLSDQKSLSEILYQALIRPSSAPPEHGAAAATGCVFLGSNQTMNFPFSTSNSYENNVFSNFHNNGGECNSKSMEDPGVSNWLQLPTTNSASTEMGSYWNWDDADLNLQWDDDDSDFKPKLNF